jgi:hypothetical protein
MRQTLRFAHSMVYRVAQFVPYVRCLTTTRYEYREGADPQRLLALLAGGPLQADDPTRADNGDGEHEVLELIAARDWQALFASAPPAPSGTPQRRVSRRWMFRPIDRIRESMPRGDL